MWTKSKTQLKISFRKFKIILFRNEEGNFYRYESDCLNAIMPTVINGKTQLYCEACDTACQFCPRKGHWIKFSAYFTSNCYCDMTACTFHRRNRGGVTTTPTTTTTTVATVRCSGNAIMDGRGNCIDLVKINPNHDDENLEDLFGTDNGRSFGNGSGNVDTVRCYDGKVMDGRGICVDNDENHEDLFGSTTNGSTERKSGSSKIILLLLLALCY